MKELDIKREIYDLCQNLNRNVDNFSNYFSYISKLLDKIPSKLEVNEIYFDSLLNVTIELYRIFYKNDARY